jgi:hypothetical protein
MFNVQQRGIGQWTTAVYTADRWLMNFAAGDTCTTQIGPLGDTHRAAIGDEAATSCLTLNFTGGSGATNNVQLIQRIEGARRTANKTITISFYANSAVANIKVGVSIDQTFGTGGSPSAAVVISGSSVTLSPTVGQFARYSVTINMPSIAGKTFGTNNDDQMQLHLWLSAGSNFPQSNIGVQSGTVSFWGMQLEIGSAATPLEKVEYVDDLRHCQRFYQAFNYIFSGYTAAGGVLYSGTVLLTTMRIGPTMSFANITYGNCNALLAGTLGISAVSMQVTTVAIGFAYVTFQMILTADL